MKQNCEILGDHSRRSVTRGQTLPIRARHAPAPRPSPRIPHTPSLPREDQHHARRMSLMIQKITIHFKTDGSWAGAEMHPVITHSHSQTSLCVAAHSTADTRGPENAADTRATENVRKRFCCRLCGFESHVDYFGRQPPFNRMCVYLEDCFVIRNPGLGSPNRPLCLGSTCVVWCATTAFPADTRACSTHAQGN